MEQKQAQYHVYHDISQRTDGEIYLGVVGPVRTGKSTFIKRFMELLVLPGIGDEAERNRAKDELPQSATGRTIMTTEPKFVPKDAAQIAVSEQDTVSVRLVDCVGFMVDGATGHMEGETERLVKTPWYDYEIPFTQAAELGTRKVIRDHSTIGIVMMTDGSIGELPYETYVPALEKTIGELRKIGKPFVVVLNCIKPHSEDTKRLARQMEEAYHIHVVPVNCEQMKKDDVLRVMQNVLEEFPVSRLEFSIPKWVELLPATHEIKAGMIQLAKEFLQKFRCMKDCQELSEAVSSEMPYLKGLRLENTDYATGVCRIAMDLVPKYYYQTVSSLVDLPIQSEYQLIQSLYHLAKERREVAKIKEACDAVKTKGYGVVTPLRDEIVLEEPVLIRQGNKYGIKIKAEAPSIHLIKAGIETEIAPIVGSEEQAQDLIRYIKEAAKNGQDGVWETNIFGKSTDQIVSEGIASKIAQMTEDCQQRLQEALQKIINDSNGAVVCIIL